MFDSYIRAIRWATDRIGDQGVIAFVTNGGWIDSNSADGIRLSFSDEFSKLFVYNLRGNAIASSESRRKEAGNVFGAGTRATIAILIAVKSRSYTGACEIRYRDIGDFLTQEQKLSIIETGNLAQIESTPIAPNTEGDWISQRSDAFMAYHSLGDKKGTGGPIIFQRYSLGVSTNRDAWVYNYSRVSLKDTVKAMIAFYNQQMSKIAASKSTLKANRNVPDNNPTRISWSAGLIARAARGISLEFRDDGVRARASTVRFVVKTCTLTTI